MVDLGTGPAARAARTAGVGAGEDSEDSEDCSAGNSERMCVRLSAEMTAVSARNSSSCGGVSCGRAGGNNRGRAGRGG